jgi:hypothetical protein
MLPLLLLLLLALLLILPALDLVAAEACAVVSLVHVVCHDALFLNTTGLSIARKSLGLAICRGLPGGRRSNIQPRSILHRAHRRGWRRKLRMNGAGNDRARKRQANEIAAEIDAVRKKVMVRMTALRINTRTGRHENEM